MFRLFIASALLAAGAMVQAEAGANTPIVRGTACPAGTASAGLTRSALSIRFSAFKVAAGGKKAFERKSCSVSVAIAVSPGKSVAIVSADYRGKSQLPAGAKAQLRAEHFFTGGTGLTMTRIVTGPVQGPFKLSTAGKRQTWSPCGADVILRANSSLRVSTRGKAATAEVIGTVVIGLEWRSC